MTNISTEKTNPDQNAYLLMAEELGMKADPLTVALLGITGTAK